MLHLEIISPDKVLFSGDIKIVKLPGVVGSFEILAHHAPLISTLGQGTIKLREANDALASFEINGGMVEVSNNQVKVLIEV
jgi:F-type H+-transporting ATPase subunit epsilon